MKRHLMLCVFALCFIMAAIACSQEGPATVESAAQKPEISETASAPSVNALKGAKIFQQKCKTCHGEGGKGDICPNLTDKDWKYGNSDEQLLQTISKGRPGGMPGWGNALSKEQIMDLIAYIRSIGALNK